MTDRLLIPDLEYRPGTPCRCSHGYAYGYCCGELILDVQDLVQVPGPAAWRLEGSQADSGRNGVPSSTVSHRVSSRPAADSPGWRVHVDRSDGCTGFLGVVGGVFLIQAGEGSGRVYASSDEAVRAASLYRRQSRHSWACKFRFDRVASGGSNNPDKVSLVRQETPALRLVGGIG